MGRAGGGGGGGGGGRSSGGGGGGGRSFGGGGGGGRSSGGGGSRGGFSSNGRSGGPAGRPGGSPTGGPGGPGGMGGPGGPGWGPRPPRRGWRGWFPYWGGGYYGGSGGCAGCGSGMIIFVVVFLIIFISAISSGVRSCSMGGTDVIVSDVAMSTVEREKLADGLASFDEYYLDELDWIYDEDELYSGMKTFYDETGVAPFLYLTDNIDGDYDPDEDTIETALNDFYDEHFDDEGHLLVLFMEDEYGYWQRYYIVGSAAKAVMDDEACQILMDYLDAYYYDDDLEDEEYFSTVFEKTATRIMQVTSSDTGTSTLSIVFASIVILAVVIVVVWVVVRYMRKRQRTQV